MMMMTMMAYALEGCELALFRAFPPPPFLVAQVELHLETYRDTKRSFSSPVPCYTRCFSKL